METPQFKNKIKQELLSSPRIPPDYIMRAPMKCQNKKNLAIKRNMILTSGYTSGVRKLDFNSSPALNEIKQIQARLFEDKKHETPLKRTNIFDQEKEYTIIQSQKRKIIERSSFESKSNECEIEINDENNSHTEKRLDKNEMKQNQYNSEISGKKLKPILSFRSSIRFSTDKQEQTIFNLYRDREIHSNICFFNQNYKMQVNDNDCSTDDEAAQVKIKVLTESILSATNQNTNQMN